MDFDQHRTAILHMGCKATAVANHLDFQSSGQFNWEIFLIDMKLSGELYRLNIFVILGSSRLSRRKLVLWLRRVVLWLHGKCGMGQSGISDILDSNYYQM